MQVLVEFVEASDPSARELFGRLLDMTRNRRTGYLLTSVDMSIGGERWGTVAHLLLDERGNRTGGFPGDGEALEVKPPARLLKPAQLLDVPGREHPVFLEWIHPRGTVYIFGAGHVGVCVAHLASYVDFRVVVVDDRAEFADREKIPDADEVIVVESFDEFFAADELDEDSYAVIVTRGHAHDKTVLGKTLRTRAGYVGMIGSRRKTALIYQALLMEGFSRDDLQRVHAPIGLPIGGETPQEIGVSIVAEMIQVRNRKDMIQGREG